MPSAAEPVPIFLWRNQIVVMRIPIDAGGPPITLGFRPIFWQVNPLAPASICSFGEHRALMPS